MLIPTPIDTKVRAFPFILSAGSIDGKDRSAEQEAEEIVGFFRSKLR